MYLKHLDLQIIRSDFLERPENPTKYIGGDETGTKQNCNHRQLPLEKGLETVTVLGERIFKWT